jgi:hypothetical protein
VRGFWTVLSREVAERRLLLLAAAVTGLFPFAVPLLPGFAGGDPSEMRSGTALALGLIFSAVAAVTLGASVIAGELAERRLGFYFARPLAGWAIWAGKLAGGVVLCAGVALLVLLPALLLNSHVELGTPWWLGDSSIRSLPAFLVLLVLGAAFLLLATHVVSSMARSRSPWLLLDLGAAFAVAVLVWNTRLLLVRQSASLAFSRGFVCFLVAAAAACLLASSVQVTRGRTDLRRGHRLLSLTLWGLLGLATLGFAAYARWVVNASPSDLEVISSVTPARSGSWIGLRGQAAGRGDFSPSFLFDTSSGRFYRISSTPYYLLWGLQPTLSPDGRRAAWIDTTAGGLDLRTVDLTRPGAQPASTAVSLEEWPFYLALSPGGTRIAIVSGSKLTVDDLATGRLLASVSLETTADGSFALRFSDDRHLRIFQAPLDWLSPSEPRSLTVLDLDLNNGRLVKRSDARIVPTLSDWAVSADGSRAAVRSGGRLLLLDPDTGRAVADLPLTGTLASIAFVSDGRLLVNERTDHSSVLHVVDRDGTELRRFPFPKLQLFLGGEVAPGLLAMTTHGWSTILLNLDTGRTTPLDGVIPAIRGAGGSQSAGSRLFFRSSGELVLLDPATGHLRTLLKTRPRRTLSGLSRILSK